LLGIAAHVLERQHRNRGLVGQSKGRLESDRRSGWRSLNRDGPNPVDPHWPCDVFEGLLAHVLERKVELTRYVLLYPSRHTNPARIGQCFQPSGNIHSVPENVAVLDDDIANIDTYSKFDAIFGGDLCIFLGYCTLDLTRTPHGIYYTGELDQQAVPGGFNDTPSMLGDGRIDYFGADRPKPVEGSFLVRSLEPL